MAVAFFWAVGSCCASWNGETGDSLQSFITIGFYSDSPGQNGQFGVSSCVFTKIIINAGVVSSQTSSAVCVVLCNLKKVSLIQALPIFGGN